MKDLPDFHDLNNLRAALGYVEGRGLAIDAGAHRGIWTREMAGQFETVYAFEPVTANFNRLPVLSNVHRFNVALGGHNGSVEMQPGRENTGQWHIARTVGQTMLAILDDFELSPDFLKIDVEGYELPVLKGAEETIERSRPAIMLEMNGLCGRYGYTEKDMVQWLTDRGYRQALRRNKDYLFVS